MFQIHYLNKISQQGTALWTEDFALTDSMDTADGIVLRSANMHEMEIIGTFLKDEQRYYVCRNSAGKIWGNQGLIYLSEDYLRLKTIAVFMSEEAFLFDRK